MKTPKAAQIANQPGEPTVLRCAHYYRFVDCPYRYCAGRAMLEALQRIDRQAMSLHPIGHDAIMAVRAALRLAGQKPAPEYKPRRRNLPDDEVSIVPEPTEEQRRKQDARMKALHALFTQRTTE